MFHAFRALGQWGVLVVLQPAVHMSERVEVGHQADEKRRAECVQAVHLSRRPRGRVLVHLVDSKKE